MVTPHASFLALPCARRAALDNLDQGMVMAALGNELTGDRLQRYLTRGAVERAVRPLLAMEEFTAGG
jgi:BarA-like signal transduction histidine kinase